MPRTLFISLCSSVCSVSVCVSLFLPTSLCICLYLCLCFSAPISATNTYLLLSFTRVYRLPPPPLPPPPPTPSPDPSATSPAAASIAEVIQVPRYTPMHRVDPREDPVHCALRLIFARPHGIRIPDTPPAARSLARSLARSVGRSVGRPGQGPEAREADGRGQTHLRPNNYPSGAAGLRRRHSSLFFQRVSVSN